ncbi:transposase family protein [Ferrimonas sediminum]
MIEDPRQEWKITHKLYNIIFLPVCAVIGGCNGLPMGNCRANNRR